MVGKLEVMTPQSWRRAKRWGLSRRSGSEDGYSSVEIFLHCSFVSYRR